MTCNCWTLNYDTSLPYLARSNPWCHNKARYFVIYFRFLFSEEDVSEIVSKSDGYSGADMANLCREAAMGPIRSMDLSLIENMDVEQVINRTGSFIENFFFF